MSATQTAVKRPRRWDTPFDENLDEQTVDGLMSVEPFVSMDESAFSKALPLRSIIKNDCHVLDFTEGDIIFRQGDYGNSAFLILSGKVLVAVSGLPSTVLGRKTTSKKSWFEAVGQLWTNSRVAEARNPTKSKQPVSHRLRGENTQMFIQDIPRVVDIDQAIQLGEGELFGEVAALTRTPRSTTVIAATDCRLFEMRWQGLRDLIQRDRALRDHIEKLYREHSLQIHLRQTSIMSQLDEDEIDVIADATEFESYGNFDWNHKFKTIEQQDVAERIMAEPLIAGQGQSVDGLILIRNGFARLSRAHGDGHQTIAYLGKGEVFGLRELVHNHRTAEKQPWLLSLRAVGYVDILRIPTAIVEKLILPNLTADQLPPPIELSRPDGVKKPERRQTQRENEIETSLLEFLVENRFINGTEAMMIDLDRCTRCDDCVRACAATHDNNPRFLRGGPQHDHWMIAGACMHCIDPVCMIGCPTGAISRDPTTGNVIINDVTCIGCATCAGSCPYDNIRMVSIRDRKGKPLVDLQTEQPIQKATKCDLCSEQPGGPACQRACPHDALVRIDLTLTDTLYQLTNS